MTTHNARMLAMSAEAIADDVSITHDELFDYIVAIDARIGQWSFTDRLVAHFAGLGQVHEIERRLDQVNSERVDITDDATESRMRS